MNLLFVARIPEQQVRIYFIYIYYYAMFASCVRIRQ